MPTGGLTLPTIAIFLSSFLVLLTLTLIAASIFGAERRRQQRRLRRAAGGQRSEVEEREARLAHRSVRKDELSADWNLLDRIVAAVVPGYERLNAKLVQSGISLSATNYVFLSCGLTGAIIVLFWGMLQITLAIAILIGIVAGLLVPYMYVRWAAHKRTEKFLRQLPEALDLVSRGLKSGLPIMESIQAVATDFDDPIRTSFATVHNKATLGATLEDALWSVANELKIQEFNFFAISVSIQRETGGNLTDSLQNLSNILRRRHNMKLKVRALSSEARASAYILTSLPFLLTAAISVINPEYMAGLYQDPRGLVMIAAALTSIGLGIAVMVKMVNFEI